MDSNVPMISSYHLLKMPICHFEGHWISGLALPRSEVEAYTLKAESGRSHGVVSDNSQFKMLAQTPDARFENHIQGRRP
jgi:hypothetical protein